MNDSASRRALNLHGAVKIRICLLKVARDWTPCSIKLKAGMLDLGCGHWPSMCGEHFSEVLREGIDLLLEEEKGCTDGTQLPLIKYKGEFIHLIINASRDKLQRHHSLRQKQGGWSAC